MPTPGNLIAYAIIGLILWWFTGIGAFLSGVLQSLATATTSYPDVSRVFQYLANNPLIATILIVAMGFMALKMAPAADAAGAPGGGIGGILTTISDSIRGIYNAIVIPLLRGGGGIGVAVLAVLVIFFIEPKNAIDGLRQMTGVDSKATLFLLMAALLGLLLVFALGWTESKLGKKAITWLFIGAIAIAFLKIYSPSTYVQGKATAKATPKTFNKGVKQLHDSTIPPYLREPIDESKKNNFNP